MYDLRDQIALGAGVVQLQQLQFCWGLRTAVTWLCSAAGCAAIMTAALELPQHVVSWSTTCHSTQSTGRTTKSL